MHPKLAGIHIFTPLFLIRLSEVDFVIISVLQMKKLRYPKAKYFVQSPRTRKWLYQRVNADKLALGSVFLTSMLYCLKNSQ